MNSTRLVTLLLSIGLLTNIPMYSVAQTPKKSTQASGSVEKQQQFENELTLIKSDVNILKAEVQSSKRMDTWFLAITVVLTVILVASAGWSVWTGRETLKMAKSLAEVSEVRTDQVHKISVAGAAMGQAHAEEVQRSFLQGSKETLELVNYTLNLAKQATERTFKLTEKRLKSEIDEYDRNAIALIDKATVYDDRELVTNIGVRNDLIALGGKIEEMERELRRLNIELLESERPLALTPTSLFVLGMTHHLAGRWKRALDYWEAASHAPNCPPTIASRIWYWIGYEQNNIGKSGFDESVASFGRAMVAAEGPRLFELRRIETESRFFHLRDQDKFGESRDLDKYEPLVDYLKKLLKTVEDERRGEFDSVKRSIITTLGNMNFSIGNGLKGTKGLWQQEKYHQYLEDALPYYDAREGEEHIWLRFGRAQTLDKLEKSPAQMEENYGKVVTLLQREFPKRKEPRTLMLYYATQMYSAGRLGMKDVFSSARLALHTGMEGIEPPVTIYSQEEKCNVSKEKFLEEVSQIVFVEKTPAESQMG